MKRSLMCAVALSTAISVIALGGCANETEIDGIELKVKDSEGRACECASHMLVKIKVYVGQEGSLTCNGETWDFDLGLDIAGVCADPEKAGGFEMEFTLKGWAEIYVEKASGSGLPPKLEFIHGGSTSRARELKLDASGTVTLRVPKSEE